MTTEFALWMVEVINGAATDIEASVYYGYSGRGMMGKITEGVFVNGSGPLEIQVIETLLHAFLAFPGLAVDMPGLTSKLKSDSLGEGIILY